MDEHTKRVLIIGIVLLLIWSSLFIFLLKYKDQMRDHPCQLCAKKMGEEIRCFSGLNQITFPIEEDGIDEQDKG